MTQLNKVKKLRTITFDDSTHKLVPLEPTEDQLLIMHERNYDMQNSAWFDKWLAIYKSGIAAAPEYCDKSLQRESRYNFVLYKENGKMKLIETSEECVIEHCGGNK